MKTLLTTLLLLLSCELTANELKWVDEQIESIKPPRSGISRAGINAIKSPFIFLRENNTKTKASSVPKLSTVSTSSRKNKVFKKSKKLALNAIINKSALINNKWYKIKDKIGKYTLSSIDGSSVILSYGKKELLLSTSAKNSNLKFKNN